MHPTKVICIYFLLILFFLAPPAFSIQFPDKDGLCVQEQAASQVCEERSSNTTGNAFLPNIGLSKENKQRERTVAIYFFEGTGCPFCEKEKVFLEEMKSKYKGLQVKQFEVWHNRGNAVLMSEMMNAYGIKPQGVPVTFIGEKVFIGFSEQIKADMEYAIERCFAAVCPDPYEKSRRMLSKEGPSSDFGTTTSIQEEEKPVADKPASLDLPIIGNIELTNMSLPVLTFMIAGLDSFNPCAFFVLFALLGLLTHAGSRKRIFFIGGVFVFFSGFIYFIFMAAWLNLFIFMGHVSGITTTAGIISLLISAINIKDFFAFKKGISLTIPESAKPGLFDRMRKLMRSTSSISILVGTVVLAVTANSYEILCTAGFPLVYTRILTLNELSTSTYYLYLVFYNLVYVIPLLIIVVIFTVTFGKKKLTERHARLLKLMSGVMMFELGGLLLFKPELLNNVAVSAGLLAGAILITLIAAYFTRKQERTK